MKRRQYLGASSLALVSIAGCSGADPDEGEGDPAVTNDSDPSASANDSDPPDSGEDSNTTEEDSGQDDEPEERLDPPEIESISLDPERYGPDDKIPRGVNIIATISGGSPLEDGGNELRAEIEIVGQDRREARSEMFEVTGEGDYTEFTTEFSLSTSPFLPGAHMVTVGLFDDEMNADVGSVQAQFELAEYNINELQEAERLLNQLNNQQQAMIDGYTSYGSVSTIDEVSVVLNNFSGTDLRESPRDARKTWAELDIAAPDAMDETVDQEAVENDLQWEFTYYHEEFVQFTSKVIEDLELLREFEFEEYSNTVDEYPNTIRDLEDRQDTCEDYLSTLNEDTASYNYTARVEAFSTDITAMSGLIPALEYLQSATETVALARLLAEDNDRGRRESRLEAMDRIRSARGIIDGIEIATSGGVIDEVRELSNDIEAAADEL